jgi:hypothetical protein
MTDKKCFIIMPVSTPPELVSVYNEDSDHFQHVMEHLFIPAIKKAGFEPILPITEGSDIIHGHIISNLDSSDLVLCDMSTNNPNVFFEFGIRTALNKPVCVVKDHFLEKVPFDVVSINYHVYSPDLPLWKVENEIDKLTEHIRNSFSRSDNCNSLWKYFGTKTQSKEDTATENTSKETSCLINPTKFKKLEGIVVATRYGLIKRCPQCEKILQKGQCPIHEKVKGIYDLYLEAILYNGILVNNLTIKRPVLEKYFGTSIDTCIKIAADNLNPDVILDMFSKQMIGNRFVLKGIYLPYSFDVKSMEIDERYSHESALKLYEKWESDEKR